ncbi:MAG TPA: DUF2911 domain-containing protein [Gemmatimonadales bacterium]|nr:DUF2911 domain-containing protein [Gemmatimonadales bacterium]
MLMTIALSLLAATHSSAGTAGTGPVPACILMNLKNLPLATRQSPLDSLSFPVKGGMVKVCYGRPSARGRTMIGGENVPYGKLWRTGANEPTMIHTTVPLTIAGIAVPAGSYSLYTVPGESEWVVIVNRSITQWGEEHGYTREVEAKEVGRGKVKPGKLDSPIEQFTIRSEAAGADGATLILEWEHTQVRIPVSVQ